MAIQITLEFTDGQWKLIEEFFLVPSEGGQTMLATKETLKDHLELFVRKQTTKEIKVKAAKDLSNAFDV